MAGSRDWTTGDYYEVTDDIAGMGLNPVLRKGQVVSLDVLVAGGPAIVTYWETSPTGVDVPHSVGLTDKQVKEFLVRTDKDPLKQ